MSKQIANDVDFVKAWEANETVGKVAELLSMKVGTAQARASKLRKDGIPLKSMRRGNGGRPKTDRSAILAVLAEIRQVSVEDLMKDKMVKEAVKAADAVATQG